MVVPFDGIKKSRQRSAVGANRPGVGILPGAFGVLAPCAMPVDVRRVVPAFLCLALAYTTRLLLSTQRDVATMPACAVASRRLARSAWRLSQRVSLPLLSVLPFHACAAVAGFRRLLAGAVRRRMAPTR